MSVERVAFSITSDSAGKGTAFSTYPIEGRILEWVAPNPGATALFGAGGTATITATRTGGTGSGAGSFSDGGTVLALTAQTAPWRISPRPVITSQSGGTTFFVAGSATSAIYDTSGVPSADYIQVVVTQGGTAVSGTVFMFYDRDHT